MFDVFNWDSVTLPSSWRVIGPRKSGKTRFVRFWLYQMRERIVVKRVAVDSELLRMHMCVVTTTEENQEAHFCDVHDDGLLFTRDASRTQIQTTQYAVTGFFGRETSVFMGHITKPVERALRNYCCPKSSKEGFNTLLTAHLANFGTIVLHQKKLFVLRPPWEKLTFRLHSMCDDPAICQSSKIREQLQIVLPKPLVVLVLIHLHSRQHHCCSQPVF